MFAANVIKYVFRRASTSVGYIIDPLPNAFHCVGAGCNIKQVLIGFCILHNCLGLPLYRQHHGALALLKLFYKVARPAAEGGQGLNVLGDV
jgi:hypothetical protein